MTKLAKYDESNIERYAGLIGIRKKSTVYIGPNDSNGLWTILREPADNAVDLALKGHNNKVHIVFDPDNKNRYWVIDNGPGFPVKHKEFEDERGRKEKLSTFYVATGLTHAGSNFDSDEASRGCFVGSTKIELVDGRILTFRKLYKEYKKGKTNYVWSVCRKTGQLRAQPIENVQLTKKTKKLVKVYLDNGESFICTPDHPLYQTSLKKISAENSVGTSLLAANFKNDKDGYRITNYSSKVSQRLNRVVADYYDFDIDDKHVHHKDENKKNNVPENLEALTPYDHWLKHPEKMEIWMNYVTETAHEKSKLLNSRNQDPEYIDNIIKSKCVTIVCRLIHEKLPLTKKNYNAFLKHSHPNYKTALTYFEKDELYAIAYSLYKQATVMRKKNLNKGKRFFDKLNYETGLSSRSTVYDQTDFMAAKRVIGKILAVLPNKLPSQLSPIGLHNIIKGTTRAGCRSLCQYIDIEEFISAVTNNVDPIAFVYKDLTFTQRIRRQHKWDKELALYKSKKWGSACTTRQFNDFLRKINVMLGEELEVNRHNFNERWSNANGKSSWYTGYAASKKFGISTKNELINEAENVNHKVIKVKHLTLNEAVPVYDLTIPVDHNYRLNCGVIVGNTHGIGIKATNAMSKLLKVYTFRDGSWHTILYKDAKLKEDVSKSKAPKLPHGIKVTKGTVVCFEPDLSLFTKGSKIELADVLAWCELTSYLVPNIEVKVTTRSGKTKIYKTKGISEYIDKKLTETKSEKMGKIFVHHDKFVDIGLAFANAENPSVNAYTNGLLNVDGGEHVKAVYDALAKSLKPYNGKSKKPEYKPTDLRDGVVGLINAKVAAPKFSNQRKDALLDDRVYKPCYEGALAAFTEFFKANKKLAQEIIRRASLLRKKTADFLNDKKLIKNVNSARKKLSSKLADVNGKTPFDQRELFIVEGDSAGGTSKRARDKSYQAVFPLKGKPLNVMEAPKDKINSNEEFAGLFAALGLDLGGKDPSSKMRYGKLIILADPDVDGGHISVLLLTLIHRYLPFLLKQGKVFIVNCPEYLTRYKGKTYFGYSKEELYTKTKSKKIDITHLKGLGECSDADLRFIAMSPESRSLTKILPPKTPLDRKRFEGLMSKDSTYRKKLLEIV